MAQADSVDLPDGLSELFSREGLDSATRAPKVICPSG
jgi:hypothetical protein